MPEPSDAMSITSLYVSHALSTWQARSYEFAAILFTASAYPDTLLFSSIRGILQTAAAIYFSSMIGAWIDRAPSRFKTLSATISTNRLSVILACCCWLVIVDESAPLIPTGYLSPITLPHFDDGWQKNIIFTVAIFLGTVERLSGSANMICMERDWVPTLASASGILATGDAGDPDFHRSLLTQLNAVMRRIDLICKLVSPLVISAIINITGSTVVGVTVVGVCSLLSWTVEIWCARRTYSKNTSLQQPKQSQQQSDAPKTTSIQQNSATRTSILQSFQRWLSSQTTNFRSYFASTVWVPSLSLSLLYISVLSYSATFITFLLSTGFSLGLVTIARAIGSIIEVSSTWVAPRGINFLARRTYLKRLANMDRAAGTEDEGLLSPSPQSGRDQMVALQRIGLWGIWEQLINLSIAVLAIWAISNHFNIIPDPPPSALNKQHIPYILGGETPDFVVVVLLFAFLSMSRLGLWTFDLAVQEMTQSSVPTNQRSSFAGTEATFISTCELGQWILTAIFHRIDDFMILTWMSLIAVGLSACLYTGWVWRKRGHILHFEWLKLCQRIAE